MNGSGDSLQISQAASRLFERHTNDSVLRSAKADGWSAPVWQALAGAGYTLLGISEEAGGAGGSLADLGALLRAAGRCGAALPLAETHVAAWMLQASGLGIPQGPLSFAPAHGESVVARQDAGHWVVSGSLRRVPWATQATAIAVLATGAGGEVLAVIDPRRCGIKAGRNIAQESRDDLTLHEVKLAPEQVASAGRQISGPALLARAALLRSVQIIGALERALELSVQHAQTRVQFGRKIGQFQAIQQELARLAGETGIAVAAVMSAVSAMQRGADARLAAAVAKSCASRAASEVAAIAHQVHGAIGMTEEHALHHATLRLWAWGEEFGNEARWQAYLGEHALAAGADRFWPALTADDL